MSLNIKNIVLSGLLITNGFFANAKGLEYKMNLFPYSGSFVYEENYNQEKNETDMNGEINISGPFVKISKTYKTTIKGDKTFYWENDIFKDTFYVNPWGTDFLTTIKLFIEHAEGDSLEKYPLFQETEDIFQVYADGRIRNINSSILKKMKIKYDGEEIEAYNVPFHGDMKTQFDFFVYNKKIVKVKIKTNKIPFSLWGELQEK